MWYLITALIVLVTVLWIANNRVSDVGGIAGLTLFASIGYVIIISFIIFAIIFIIRWSIEKMGHNI
jgi:hypothetical protein